MDKQQLTELIIIPTLKEIPKGHSEEAVRAIQMLIAHESLRCHFIKQVNGPALGIINMEPITYYDTWKNGDSIQRNAELLNIVRRGNGVINVPHEERLIYDFRYNVFMARQRLFMIKEELPSDLVDMSDYLKKYWNGPGEATPQDYLLAYLEWS